ncbi:ExeM/NucH family extracellular endonuclease [Salinimonas lutimaris]|uniref:ExeM/NucH family extracellular endonuclease n=1 Tax=Salinimonas lutimaris TaxID=914153 RepID=UPI0010C09A5E|nr:ExeM/NucH family extracellular endonuclease [Salinimonas lutimaris]
MFKRRALLPFVLCVSAPVSAEVFISEYVEGGSNNKAVELYNPDAQAIDLNGYTLSVYSNGSNAASTIIELSGTINPGGTFVLADNDASAAMLALSDQTSTQSFFNGDDAVVLSRAGSIIDSIGQVGFRPDDEWGSGNTSTKDNTLIRLAGISAGDTNVADTFDPAAQFTGLAKDDISGLGQHTYSGDAGGNGGDSGDDGVLSGVCTNCPDLDKVADAASFDASAYYSAVQAEVDAGSSMDVIRQRLSATLADGQRQLSYSQVWTALTATDEDPADPDNVLLFYSNRSIAKASNGSGDASTNPDNWNREHSWPKSHGFSSSANEAYTDIQHLRATDISVNSSRGNLDFDFSDSPLSEAPENRIDGDSFEPRDAIKGDVARMMMYMDVRYEGINGDVTPDLVLVNTITASGDAALGKLCTLIEWHNADPVDEAERTRQAAIYEYQGNRNPFVDRPEWVDVLYSAQSCDASTGGDTGETDEPVDPQPEAGSAPLMLTGIYDGPLSGGVPKGIELLVTEDMDDLSVCGVGSANNGGGSAGEEFIFPSRSVVAGEFIYIASETTGFTSFFGFAPDYTSSAMSINGDDAIEVFCHGERVDVYGDINVDGTGQDWEYLDSFAYRTGGTANGEFTLSQWSVPGANTWDGENDNSTAAVPFPAGSFALIPATLFFSEYVEGSSFNKALELVNTGATPLDASEYAIQIFSNGNQTGQTPISLSGTVAPGDVLVIANNQADSQIAAVADVLTGQVSFNGDDAVVLLHNGEIVDAIGQIGVRTEWGSGDTSTQDNTLRRKATVTGGDNDAYDAFDPALEWDGFANNTFDGLGQYSGTGDNGGGDNGGGLAACGEPATFIHEVQGDGMASPLAGQSVSVEAIISHLTPKLSGYFIQEEATDYDDSSATSEGVFVYAPQMSDALQAGDVVRLQGEVSERYGRTQISISGEPVVCGTGTVAVTPVSLPQASDNAFESVEGMLVTSNENWVVNNVYNYGSYGEATVSSKRLYTATQRYGADTPEAQALAAANALDQLLIDDNSDGGDNTSHLLTAGEFGPYNALRSGDVVASVTGVMDYGFSAYRIRPLFSADVVVQNPRQDSIELAAGNLTIASFNVLNLFNGDGQGQGFPTSRGADSVSEYERQLAKIVEAMVTLNADVFGLLELENDGYDASSTIAQLTDALNQAVGDTRYAYIDVGSEQLGTDAIASGIIYRQDVVTPAGAASVLSSANSMSDENGPLFADNNRPSLAQLFVHTETGNEFVVDVNHFKSKGSSCGAGDDHPLAGSCNLTRTRAAIAVTAWLSDLYADKPQVILGDLNAYAKEDPIQYLENAGFADTLETVQGDDVYSYTFRGEAGTLDYQLINSDMQQYLVDAQVWHINADEAPALDYNEEYKPQSWLNTLVFRASDHDPVITSYNLPAALVKGDWDGDGDVDFKDIRGFMMAVIFRQPIGSEFDLNGDGKVNIRDLRLMRTLCTRTGCKA